MVFMHVHTHILLTSGGCIYTERKIFKYRVKFNYNDGSNEFRLATYIVYNNTYPLMYMNCIFNKVN